MPTDLGAIAGRARRFRESTIGRGRHLWRCRRSQASRLSTQLGSAARATDVLDSWVRWSRDTFFFAPTDSPRIAAQVDDSVPGFRQATLTAADKISAHQFRVLGHEVELPPSLNWHRDMINDYEWNPGRFFGSIEIPYDRADIKAPWELSMFQHLSTLGLAYLLTGKQRYATEVVEQIDDWISANPEGRGVNWRSPMIVAIRAVNWLWAYNLIPKASAFTDAFAERFLASLLAHGEHIHNNLELGKHGIATNHAVANFTGLLVLGLSLPELAIAERWVADGMSGLEQCMVTQVHSDGVDFENSLSYHRLVLEMFSTSQLLAERNGKQFSPAYNVTLARMFRFVQHYLRPDGTAPFIGDNDDARLQVLSRYFTWKTPEHRYLLALGGAILRDKNLAGQGLGDPFSLADVSWLVSDDARSWLEDCEPSAGPSESCAFPSSGRYVVRHSGHHALISADAVGSGGLGNHKHNDIFSYDLSVDGQSLVVDPGTYLYTSSQDWRDRFRSTRAHNTVMVEDEEQNAFAGWFGMRADAQVTVHTWASRPEAVLLDASHSGYQRLSEPATHQRQIVVLYEPFVWLVIDQLITRVARPISSCVQLSADSEVQMLDTVSGENRGQIADALRHVRQITSLPKGWDCIEDRLCASMRIDVNDVSVNLVPLACELPQPEVGMLAPAYGVRVSAPALRFEHQARPGRAFGYVLTRTNAKH